MKLQTVLIIEDSPDVGALLTFALTSKGCQAYAVSSRDDALLHIRSKGLPDTIIMDFHMPGMGVEAFLYELAIINSRIPRLVLTTAGAHADDLARKFNFTEVLRKPFDAKNVLAQIEGCR